MPLELKYRLVGVRREAPGTPGTFSFELVDDTVSPPNVRRAVFWLGKDQLDKLSSIPMDANVIVKIEQEPELETVTGAQSS